MPLFCWKIYVNCAAFEKHVCCSVMQKKKKRNLIKEESLIALTEENRKKIDQNSKKRDQNGNENDQNGEENAGKGFLTRQKRNVDPLFGIPIKAQMRKDDIQYNQQQSYRPYSPYYIGLPGYQKPEGKHAFLVTLLAMAQIRIWSYLNSGIDNSVECNEYSISCAKICRKMEIT